MKLRGAHTVDWAMRIAESQLSPAPPTDPSTAALQRRSVHRAHWAPKAELQADAAMALGVAKR